MDVWTLMVITPYEEGINRAVTDRALVDIGCNVNHENINIRW